MIGRDKAAKVAKEIADHLEFIENVKSLQIAQKEMADEIKLLRELLADMKADIRALKAEAKAEAIKEAQGIVNAVQSGFYQRLETVSNKMAVIEARFRDGAAIHGVVDTGDQQEGVITQVDKKILDYSDAEEKA